MSGCHKTVDVIGYNESNDAQVRQIRHLTVDHDYPNAFHDVLGKSTDEIQSKINTAFEQLFHGDAASQSIYFIQGADQAIIRDVYHGNQIRTEGMGLGMMIAVQLNKRDEFDRLWRFSKQNLLFKSGSQAGYFLSVCDTSTEATESRYCLDPFGLEQFAMALVLANNRWSDGSTDAGEEVTIDYNADAWAVFDVMRYKEQQNGGVVDGVTNSFDAQTRLPFDEPNVRAFNYARLALAIPAFYEMWRQATGDIFWAEAAINARGFIKSVANSETGLLPVRAYFSGRPYEGWNIYAPEGYRSQFNMALDWAWTAADPWNVTEANRIIDFFYRISNGNVTDLADIYDLGGAVVDATAADTSLVAVNGCTALSSSSPNRKAFISAVWNAEIPTGAFRYYSGLMYLTSLLLLGGEFRVY